MKKLTDQILKDVITPRPENSFKGTFGKVTLIGGNRNLVAQLSWHQPRPSVLVPGL